MCLFMGKAVGQYCACCQSCNQYLEVCVPYVGYGGYVVAECDFDFCIMCPIYGSCEQIWGEAVFE